MKKWIAPVLGAIVAMTILMTGMSVEARTPSPYGPKGKHFGLGFILGDPTGLSGKVYITERFAIDAIASWSFVDDAIVIIGDLTYDILDIPVDVQAFTLPFYIGAGAKVGFIEKGNDDGETLVGIRGPVGVAMQFNNLPIEVFFEVAPGIELAPETEADVTGGIGIRFYFL